MVQWPIPAPPGDVPVRVCFASRGAPEIGLFASSDRTRSRSIAFIDGESTKKSIWFTFAEPAPRAILERLPATVGRITVFRPAYVGRVLLWGLAILFLIGVPIAVVWAYARALRDDERSAPRELDVNGATVAVAPGRGLSPSYTRAMTSAALAPVEVASRRWLKAVHARR